jgi:DNA-binding FadR family transcriptional regulator
MIKQGEGKPNGTLSPERKLCEQLGVSQAAARASTSRA